MLKMSKTRNKVLQLWWRTAPSESKGWEALTQFWVPPNIPCSSIWMPVIPYNIMWAWFEIELSWNANLPPNKDIRTFNIMFVGTVAWKSFLPVSQTSIWMQVKPCVCPHVCSHRKPSVSSDVAARIYRHAVALNLISDFEVNLNFKNSIEKSLKILDETWRILKNL